jgi:hypothetical protein
MHKFAHDLSTLHYRLIDLRDAFDMLRSLRRHGRRIPRGSAAAALQESRRRFGALEHAVWLVAYAAARGSYQHGCFPADIYKRSIAPTLNAAVYHNARRKTLTGRLLRDDALPDRGYRIGGRFYDHEMQPIPEHQIEQRLFGDDSELVAKADGSAQGTAVQLIGRTGPTAPADCMPGRDLVFQRRIRQHHRFDRFVPDGTATLRLTTTRELDGDFRVRAAYWRIPGAGTTLMAVATGFYVPCDHRDGRAVGPGVDYDWKFVSEHPGSGVRFDSIATPAYEALCALAIRLHRRVPQVGCIGWDLMLDRSEQPWLLEWNAYSNGIAFSEAMVGPGLLGLGWDHLAPHAARVQRPTGMLRAGHSGK